MFNFRYPGVFGTRLKRLNNCLFELNKSVQRSFCFGVLLSPTFPILASYRRRNTTLIDFDFKTENN